MRIKFYLNLFHIAVNIFGIAANLFWMAANLFWTMLGCPISYYVDDLIFLVQWTAKKLVRLGPYRR